jgi:hypothetical protein
MTIGVRDLAEYSADPVAFRKRAGKIQNANAVAKGNLAHKSVHRHTNPLKAALLVIALIGLIAYVLNA